MSSSTHRSAQPGRAWSWGLLLAVVMAPALARADAGPSIEHVPVTSASAGQAVIIQANIVSNTRFAIATPTVYAHWAAAPRFTRFEMTLVPGTVDLYTCNLPSDLVTADFDYYIEAFDKDDNGPSRQGDEQHPLHVAVAAATKPLASKEPAPQASQLAVLAAPAPSPREPPAGGLTSSAPPAAGGGSIKVYVSFGVGGAGLVVAGVLMVLSLQEHSAYLTDLQAAPSRLSSDKSAANLEAGVAWSALAVGLAGAGAGTYFLMNNGSPSGGAGP